jgi:uncharacterized protein (TIGR01777 family)
VRVAVAGASGFVGSDLVPRLVAAGHEVVRLVRRAHAGAGEASWDPRVGTVDLDALAGVEAIVNLAGAGIGDKRWTEAYKATLYDSHVASARVLGRAAAELAPDLHTLVSVGAMGYYGNDTGGRRLTESSPPGTDFAARIIVDKEAATEPAAEAGVRVVLPRVSLVMGSTGGTLGRRLLPLAKVGLLGPLAGGRSIWSVVSLQDTCRALLFALEQPSLHGPVNLSAPQTTTNGEFTRLLGARVHRPTVLPVPAFGLRLVLGEFADDVLADFNVDPSLLVAAGFTFDHPDAASIIDAAVP